MSQFSHLRTYLLLAGKHARSMYLNLSKNLHQRFVFILRLDSQIRQLQRHTFVHSVTKNTKLSMFQFKINHHILYTRDKRFTAKITDSHVCESKQTLQPLFVECQHDGTIVTRPQCL